MGQKFSTTALAKAAERDARQAANRIAWAERQAEIQARSEAARGGRRAVSKLGRYLDAQRRLAARKVERIDPRLMTDAQLVEFVKAAASVDKYDWRTQARPEQIQPVDYRTWAYIAGRGAGKTRCGCEAVREWTALPNQRIAIVGADHRAIRDTLLDGPSGLLSVIPKDEVRQAKKGLGDVTLELTNGSVIYGFPAENPDSVRGRAFDAVLVDEYGAWNRNTAEDMVAQLWFCMRDTPNPRMIITTTPRRVPHIVDLIKRGEDGEPGLVVTRGKTRDNTTLSEVALQQLERMYGGTRMGRQELLGELVMDVEGALWTVELIEHARWNQKNNEGFPLPLPPLIGVVTGLDPSGSKDGDATGIVTIGWDKNKTLYVLDNATTKGTPAERYTAACMSAYRHGSGEIWWETSYGGDQAAYGVEQQWKNLQESGLIEKARRCPRMMPSRVKGDKAGRAGPLVTLYEQQVSHDDRPRIYHVEPTEENGIAAMEDELLSWEPASNKSPNALDALVHAGRAVMRLTGQEMMISSPVSGTRRISGPPGTVRQIRTGYNPFK